MGNTLPANPEYYGYLNMIRHADQNRDIYRIMLGSQGSAALTKRVHEYLADDLYAEMQRYPIYEEFTVPQPILAQIVTGAIVRLIMWWLDNSAAYTAEEVAAMLYETIHHQQVEGS